jgi:hypothetical protein
VDEKRLAEGPKVQAMREKVLGIRDSVRALFGMKSEPIPFFYIHLVTVISGLYLPLLAYGVGIQVELPDDGTNYAVSLAVGFFTSFLAVLAVALATIGLQAVGQQLADPYGDDVVDLSVLGFCASTVIATRRICAAPRPEKLSLDRESLLGARMMHALVKDGYKCEMWCEEEDSYLAHTNSRIFDAPAWKPSLDAAYGVKNPLTKEGPFEMKM